MSFIEHGTYTYIYVLYTLIARVYLAYGSVELYTSSMFALPPFYFAETSKMPVKKGYRPAIFIKHHIGEKKLRNARIIKIIISTWKEFWIPQGSLDSSI